MITLSKSGSSIVFTFVNNPLYLNDGTIEAPVNSLSLTIDSSNIATFKKAASNDIFLCTSLDELDMTKEELEDWYAENAVGGGGSGEGVTSGEVQTMIDQSISGKADTSAVTEAISAAVSGKADTSAVTESISAAVSGKADSSAVTQEISAAVSGKADSVSAVSSAEYVSSSTTINFKNVDGTVISSIDASDFIIDGMVDDVRIETISGVPYLVIDFNTASGKEDIQIPLSDIFDPSNYYTKTEVDAAVSGKADTSAVTEAISAAVSGKADTSAVTEAISAAVSGKVDTSAITTSVTSASTDSEIPSAKAVYDAIPTGSSITSGEVQTMIDQSISGKVQDVQIGNVSYLAKPASTIQVTTNGSTYLSKGFVGSINNKKILTGTDGTQTNFFSLVETSAVTSAITSASTNSEVAGAKAVYDALSEIGGGISSGEAQTMIDQSISGKADSSAVTQEISAAVSGKADTSAVTEAISAATSGKVDTTAITTSVTSGSTDSEIPTAKAVYDAIPTGSSITIDTTLDSGSSNPVANSSLYNELRIVSSNETPLEWEEAQGYNEYETTNYPSGCTVIKLTPTYLETVVEVPITVLSNETNLGMVELGWDYNSWYNIRIGVQGATYTTDGAYITITFPPSAGITKLSNYGGAVQSFYWFTVENTNTPLIDEVVSNKAAISGKADTSAVTVAISAAVSGKASDIKIADFVGAQPASVIQVTKNGNTFLARGYVGSINGKKILKGENTYDNISHFNLVETSAVTSAITSASTNDEVAGAKAVYDAISGIG